MSDRLKDPEVNERREPEDHIKDESAEEFCQHDLPVADRRRHERLDRAELKLLREQSHGDQGKNQNEGEPEENRIEERFLH